MLQAKWWKMEDFFGLHDQIRLPRSPELAGTEVERLGEMRWSSLGRAAVCPRGDRQDLSIVNDMSPLKCWMPMSFSTYQGGMAPARSRMPVFCFMRRAGDASADTKDSALDHYMAVRPVAHVN